MAGLARYLSYEMLAIHLLTGALFGVVNVVIFAVVLRNEPWFVPALLPLAAFSWWGWWAEGRFVARASREMRENARMWRR